MTIIPHDFPTTPTTQPIPYVHIHLDDNPQHECPDTERCYACGTVIDPDPEEGTLAFEGFCSVDCKRSTEAQERAYTARHKKGSNTIEWE